MPNKIFARALLFTMLSVVTSFYAEAKNEKKMKDEFDARVAEQIQAKPDTTQNYINSSVLKNTNFRITGAGTLDLALSF